jgi:hypothetical protein
MIQYILNIILKNFESKFKYFFQFLYKKFDFIEQALLCEAAFCTKFWTLHKKLKQLYLLGGSFDNGN